MQHTHSWYIRSSKIYMYCTTARAAAARPSKVGYDCQVTLLTQISLFFCIISHQSFRLSQGSRVVESSESQDIAIDIQSTFVFIQWPQPSIEHPAPFGKTPRRYPSNATQPCVAPLSQASHGRRWTPPAHCCRTLFSASATRFRFLYGNDEFLCFNK